MKKCTKCEETKSLDEFYTYKSPNTGKMLHKTACRNCTNRYTAKYNSKDPDNYMPREEWLASVRKPKVPKATRISLGIIKSKIYNIQNKDRLKDKQKQERVMIAIALEVYGYKRCFMCSKELALSMFSKKKRTRKDKTFYYGYNYECKKCKVLSNKEYLKKPGNREKNKIRQSAMVKRNRVAKPKWLSAEQMKAIHEIYKDMRTRNRLAGKIEYHVDHVVPLNGETVCGLHVPWNLEVVKAKDNIAKSNTYIDW